MGFTQYAFDAETGDTPKAEWKIQKVIAYKLDEKGERTEETADCFRLDADDVHLNIVVEKPYVPQPQPAPQPQQMPDVPSTPHSAYDMNDIMEQMIYNIDD